MRVILVQTVAVLLTLGAMGLRAAEPAKPAGTPTAEEIQKLVAHLGADQYRVREEATQKLIAIGRPAVKVVRQALKSHDYEVAHRAREVLGAIHSSVPNLIEDLKDADPAVRKEAAEGLQQLGDGAKPALPALAEAVKDKDEAARDAAIVALLVIDPDNKALADAAPAKARVQGKYAKLLRRIKVPQDRQTYTDFNDYGSYPATDYAGYTGIPQGFWVYVYPHWYIWGEMKQE
jgi:HEAT repeat protein